MGGTAPECSGEEKSRLAAGFSAGLSQWMGYAHSQHPSTSDVGEGCTPRLVTVAQGQGPARPVECSNVCCVLFPKALEELLERTVQLNELHTAQTSAP